MKLSEMVMNMTLAKYLAISTIAIFGLAACGGEVAEEPAPAVATEIELQKTAPQVTFKPSAGYDGTVAKPGSPFSISYRIIGAPIVGSPLTIDLRVTSSLDARSVTINYRINDASAMMLAESQPASVIMEPAANEESFTQQVTIIPQRDGRLYLNVSASFETENGTMSTVMAIPIQVGTGTRELQEHGVVELDEDGEAVRVLTPD
jgi:hypothetical protein